MKRLFEPNKYGFLTTWMMSLFWLLVIFRKQFYLDYLRLTFILIGIFGIILNYIYGKKWEIKYNLSGIKRNISNVICHILPLIYLLYYKPVYKVSFDKQMIICLSIFLIYTLLLNPIEQYCLE
jgi:hypothetical protein